MNIRAFLWRMYLNRGDTCVTVFNEGGSRSGKTFSTFQFLLDLCLLFPNKGLVIFCIRDTLSGCKDTAMADFKQVLELDARIHDKRIFSENSKPEFRIGRNVIKFRGLDGAGSKESFTSDIIFVNELLSGVSKEQFESVTMRCKKMVIADWNPRYTQHWAFNYEKAPNTYYTHTTFRDNPYCPEPVRQRILSFEPTPDNIGAGTANAYKWKVYGMGERAAQEGLIFSNITWIDEFPNDVEDTCVGLDFGYTNDPTAAVRVALRGRTLYAELLAYHPIADPAILCEVLQKVIMSNELIYADSSDKYAKNPDGMVLSMQMSGMNVIKVKKSPGFKSDAISIMQGLDLQFVRNTDLVQEANAYVWDSVNGIPINRPADGNDHAFDAIIYAFTMYLRFLVE